MKLLLVGFGVVGQGFVEILRDKGAALQAQYGFAPTIVGVATRSHGTFYHPDGLELEALLDAAKQGGLQHYQGRCLQRDNDIPAFIRATPADVLVEASITNLQTGQPATDYCLAAFESGKHVVLANKGPIALHYAGLLQAAQHAGRHLRFEGTVMAGTPSLTLALEALAGNTINEARGILNGTTNYILTQMGQGMEYATALAQAQQLGYAEADPTADVDGWDAAGKLLILAAALYQKKLTLAELNVEGISQISSADIEAARQAGECYKLIARITPNGGSVSPQRIPLTDPLAAVSGATNAITFSTDLLGDVTLVGAGAGRLQTGFALLADTLAIHRQVNKK